MSLNVDVAALKRKKQDEFIETRTIIEQEVNKFLTSIGTFDAETKEQCKYNPQLTARTLLPALWEEPFDEAVYNEQLAKLQAYIAGVEKVCDALNERTLQCLQ